MEIDFRSYFATIPHDKLMILIKQPGVDGSMLRLIKQSVTVEIAYGGKVAAGRIHIRMGEDDLPLGSSIIAVMQPADLDRRREYDHRSRSEFSFACAADAATNSSAGFPAQGERERDKITATGVSSIADVLTKALLPALAVSSPAGTEMSLA